MPKKITLVLFLFGLLSAASVMGSVIYLEYYHHLNPCPLCIFQRIAVMASMIVFLIAFFHGVFSFSPRAVWFYGSIGVLIALVGLSIALRHIYLQALPPSKVPGCGPGLNFLFQSYPFLDVLKIVFQGSGECSKIDWRMWGLSLADWSGIYFLGLILLNMGAIGLSREKKNLSES